MDKTFFQFFFLFISWSVQILNSLFVPLGLILAHALPVVGFRELWINFGGCIEVLNGELVVAHISIYNTSSDVYSFVILDGL